MEPFDGEIGFVHDGVGAGDLVFGVVKVSKAAAGGGEVDGFEGFAFALLECVGDGFDAGDDAAGVVGMGAKVGAEAGEGFFFSAEANEGHADLGGAEVGVEVGVDGFEFVEGFLVLAGEEVGFAHAIVGAVVAGVESDGAREIVHAFFEQADVEVDQAAIVMGFGEVWVESDGVGEVVDGVFVREMVGGGPFDAAAGEVSGGEIGVEGEGAFDGEVGFFLEVFFFGRVEEEANGVSEGEVGVGFAEIWIESDGFFEELDDARVVFFAFEV